MSSGSVRRTSVAMTSSASKPSTLITGISSAASTSRIRSTCPANSAGEVARFALYSGNASVRKVRRDTSNAAAMCVGLSSRRTLISIEVKPNTAFVGWPVVVEKFSTGRA